MWHIEHRGDCRHAHEKAPYIHCRSWWPAVLCCYSERLFSHPRKMKTFVGSLAPGLDFTGFTGLCWVFKMFKRLPLRLPNRQLKKLSLDDISVFPKACTPGSRLPKSFYIKLPPTQQTSIWEQFLCLPLSNLPHWDLTNGALWKLQQRESLVTNQFVSFNEVEQILGSFSKFTYGIAVFLQY